MPRQFDSPEAVMQRALELARQGEGFVEPNPCVGAVVVDKNLQLIAEGYHEQYGGPHAEVQALRNAGDRARGAWIFVTLEPCNHHGKTPPCSEAVIQAGIQKVFIGCLDPAPHEKRQGAERLREAGLQVEVGLCQQEAERLLRPFTKLMTTGQPYVHAKWAMTLDGKIATRTGSSQWISGHESRAVVHKLRGRCDAILTGRGTVLADNPQLTARPPGPRTPLRVVVDSQAQLPLTSQLVQTCSTDQPVLLACTARADAEKVHQLQQLGVEVQQFSASPEGRPQLAALLTELGKRKVTNLFLECGGELLGSFLDQRLIDEVHVFLGPKLVGGKEARSAVLGGGVSEMAEALLLEEIEAETLAQDVYIRGIVPFSSSTPV